MATSALQRTHSGKRTRSKHARRSGTKHSNVNEDQALMSLRVHECRFLPLKLSGVTAVATSPSGRYIVLARNDCSIELKDRGAMWTTTCMISAVLNERRQAYTGMEFSNCGSYVFACRASDIVEVFRITENGLIHHVSLSPGGGKIFDLAVCRDKSTVGFRLAVACADGRVRIIAPDPSFFAMDEDQELPTNTAFYKTLLSEKTRAPVTCLAWYTDAVLEPEECIVAGDADGGVRWINPSTGSCYGTGKIPSHNQEPVVMSTIQFSMSGKQVLCGDSRGLITVWSSTSNSISDEIQIDGFNGAVLSSALCQYREMGKSEVVVFGSESGELAALRSIPGSELWSISRARRFHVHQVRSIAALPDGTFVSSSTDSFMTLFSTEALSGKEPITFFWPNSRCVGQQDVQVFPQKRVALSNTSEVIELWSFPRSALSPTLACRMNLDRLSGVRSCSFNTKSGVLALSTTDSFKLFEVKTAVSGAINLEPVRKVVPLEVSTNVSSCLRGATDMVYCAENLVCLSEDHQQIHLYDGARVHPLNLEPSGMKAGMFFCKLASHSNKLMASDSRGNVSFCTFDDACEEKPSYQCRLLRCPQAGMGDTYVSAISFSPSGTKAAVVYTDLSLSVVDLSEERNEQSVFSSNEYTRITGCFPSIAYSISFAWTEESLLVTGSSYSKIIALSKLGDSGRNHSVPMEYSLYDREIRPAESISCSSVLGPAEVVVVSHQWSRLMENRPKSRVKRKFGT
ncbi:WD40/YVTN repeat-like containing protein [Gracilaria domingensis]|nr:WD40/YVTN repeat-like containing protein [Gracilaria domingensis]